MDRKNCAPSGGMCCGEVSCNKGEQCCTTAINLALPCAPEGSVCCGDGWCAAGSTCCGNGQGCAKEGSFCCGAISCPNGEKCCHDDDGPYCANECLPTLIFPHQEGFSEEVILEHY